MHAHLLALVLLVGSPIVARGQATQPAGVDLGAVKTLLAAGGNGRVSDAEADLMAQRLAKIRDNAPGRLGQGDTKTLLAACDSDGDGHASQTDLTTYLGKKATLRTVVKPLAVKLWKAADASRDGAVDVMEARLLADQFGKFAPYSRDDSAQVMAPAAWMQVGRVIERAHKDGSNAVSAAEVAGTSVFNAQFAGIDRDRSGAVTAGELYDMATDLPTAAQRQTCATCPRVQQAGADKLKVLQSLMTLQ